MQFEIWYFLISAFKITILLPNILITVNINYLFTNFILNSLMNIASSYMMHSKAIIAMYNEDRYSLKLSLLIAFRMFAIFMIVMSAMYPNLGLSCAGEDPYPTQLALIMYLEFLNASVDLLITIYLPRNLTKIKEERLRAGSNLGDFDMTDEDIDINELKARIASDNGETDSQPKSPLRIREKRNKKSQI